MLIGLKHRSDLNSLCGWIVEEAANNRWGVALDSGGQPLAVRTQNLVPTSAPWNLYHRSFLRCLAVVRLCPLDARPRVWEFLRDPAALVIASCTRSGKAGHASIVTTHSLASGQYLGKVDHEHADLDELCLSLQGGDFALSDQDSINDMGRLKYLWWDIASRLAVFREEEGFCFNDPIANNITRFCTSSPSHVAAISQQCDWIAMANRIGRVVVKDVASGLELNHCNWTGASPQLIPELAGLAGPIYPLMMIKVHSDTILICGKASVDIIKVTRLPGCWLQGKVCRLSVSPVADISYTNIKWFMGEWPRLSQAVALSDSQCALVTDRCQKLNLFALDTSGMESRPAYIIHGKGIVSVAITESWLLSIEDECDASGNRIGGAHCVIRCVVQPRGPPVFTLKLDVAHLTDALYCLFCMPPTSLTKGSSSKSSGLDSPRDSTYDVVVDVEDPEAPAFIPPGEAADIARAQWESAIERASSQPSSSSDFAVMVLAFSRHPRALDTILRRSLMGQYMEELNQDIQPAWANGAKILVPGLTQEAWAEAKPRIVLGPYHAVTIPGNEDAVKELLRHHRIRAKQGVSPESVKVPLNSELFADASSAAAMDKVHALSESILDMSSASAASADVAEEALAQMAWLQSVRDAVQSAQILHVNISNTFIDFAELGSITPRSFVTASAPADLPASALIVNPRIWANSNREPDSE